jgi:hypothetical protein
MLIDISSYGKRFVAKGFVDLLIEDEKCIWHWELVVEAY